MRIAEVSVAGLFGIFNHTIHLNSSERITIMTGPNGYGKTTVFRMLQGLFSRRYDTLRSIPYKEFKVVFADGTWLSVVRESDRPETVAPDLVVTYGRSTGRPLPHRVRSTSDPDRILPMSIVEDIIPQLRRRGPRAWQNMASGEMLTFPQVLERFGDQLPPPYQASKLPQWLASVLDSVQIRFIEAQRLLSFSVRERERAPMEAVVSDSDELARNIQVTLAEYAKRSQASDRSFPRRLLRHEREQQPVLSEQDLRTRFLALEERRKNLTESGLLDLEQEEYFEVPEDLTDTNRRVLTVYLDDVESKLDVFNQIAGKIDLLKNVVREHFRYKTLKIHKDKGFVFTGADGSEVGLSDLSSGEQHELVLLYELLFRILPDSLVLIDEPELSQHVGWQLHFLDDLQKVTEISSIDVLIATHSPQIIGNRWDLAVELKGPDE